MKRRGIAAREVTRKAAAAIALYPALAGLFLALIIAATALPNEPIRKNILAQERVLLDRRADNGRVIDADTECIGLSVGLYARPSGQENLLQRTVRAQSLYGCEDFLHWLKTGEAGPPRDYFRYWHGYATIARPVLSVLNYNDMRGLLFALGVTTFGALLWRIGRDFNARLLIAFAVPFLVLNALGFIVVATKAATFLAMIGAAIWLAGRREGSQAPLLGFFFIGALTAFFDFLTAPALVFALAALVDHLYRDQEPPRAALARLFFLALFWGAGWAGLWFAKVAIAASVVGPEAFSDALSAAAFRLRGETELVDGYTPGAALWANIAALKSLWGPVAALAFIVAPLSTRTRRQRVVALVRGDPALVAIVAAPLVWLEILSNHSQIHAAFTHLNFAPLFVIAGAVALNAPLRRKEKIQGQGFGASA